MYENKETKEQPWIDCESIHRSNSGKSHGLISKQAGNWMIMLLDLEEIAMKIPWDCTDHPTNPLRISLDSPENILRIP